MSTVRQDSAPWVAIQRNPWSGAGRNSHELLKLVNSLKTQGIRPRLYSRRADLDAALNDPDRRSSLLGIVAAGGDGTLLDVVNRHSDLPIAILPLGTENLFARALGIHRCGTTLAATIAQGRVKSFDTALCNERRFLIVASSGFDAEVIRRAHERRSGRISRAFYVQPIIQSLRHYRFPRIQVWVDDSPEPMQGTLAVVANLSAYALRLPIVPQATGDDGWLDVRVFDHAGPLKLSGDLLSIVLRRKASHSVRTCRARRIRIEASQAVPVQFDGDAMGGTPIDIRVDPASIRMFVP